MKKYLAVLLCVMMALGLVACGNNESVMVPSFDSNKVPAQRVAMRGGDGTIEATEATTTESKELSYEEAVDMLKKLSSESIGPVDSPSEFSDIPVVAVFAISFNRCHEESSMDVLKDAIAKIPQCIKDDTYVGAVFGCGADGYQQLQMKRFDRKQRGNFQYIMSEKISSRSGTGSGDSFGAITTSLAILSNMNKEVSIRPVLFVITDGSMAFEKSKLDEILPAVEVIDIPVHVIAYDAKLDSDNQLEELEKIAVVTGAQYVESNAESIDDDIQKLLRAVLY